MMINLSPQTSPDTKYPSVLEQRIKENVNKMSLPQTRQCGFVYFSKKNCVFANKDLCFILPQTRQCGWKCKSWWRHSLLLAENTLIFSSQLQILLRILLQIPWRLFGACSKYHKVYIWILSQILWIWKYLHRWQNSFLGTLQCQCCLHGQMLK